MLGWEQNELQSVKQLRSVRPDALRFESAFARLENLARSHTTVVGRRKALPVPPIGVRSGLILEGWASRFKTVGDARRQTVQLYLPGDLIDFDLNTADEGLEAITRVRIGFLPSNELTLLEVAFPSVCNELSARLQVAQAIQREWTVNVGFRSTAAGLGHLILELLWRSGATDAMDWPLAQNDVADAAAVTAVHVNRVLQTLRRDGLIHLANGRLRVIDLPALKRLSGFDPCYLLRASS